MSLPTQFLAKIDGGVRTHARGALEIAGVTKISGVSASCRVFMHDVWGGELLGYRRTGSDGVYSFPNLAAGDYYLVVVDDQANLKRGKVEHVSL